MANPNGPGPYKPRQSVTYQGGDLNKPVEVQYIGGLFKGSLSIIDEPNEKQLSVYAQAVYHNTPYTKAKELNADGEKGNPVPMKVGEVSPIKYVFYIIKENRTFDQVLSDVKGGNGDTSLLLFGEHYTPNLHKIVKDFVLLDNFYCDAEVSADGHNWSMGAYATDYLEKHGLRVMVEEAVVMMQKATELLPIIKLVLYGIYANAIISAIAVTVSLQIKQINPILPH